MKKIFFIFITVCVSAASFSQVGYMGKRFLINADGWVSPCWFVPNSNGNTGFLPFNYFLEPGVEFVISKKMSIGATYLNTRESKFPAVYANGKMDFPYPSYNIQKDFYIDGNNHNSTFKTHGVGLYYKYFFGRKSFAPIGYFVKAELNYFFYNYKIDAVDAMKYVNEIPNGYEDYSHILYEGESGKGSIGGIKVEVGRDFLFFNRLRLSTGIGFGVTFGGFKTNPFNNGKSPKYVYNSNDSDKIVKPTEIIYGQLLGTYWFGLRMGIGFLAF